MMSLNDKIEEYSVDNYRNEMSNAIKEDTEEAKYQNQSYSRQLDEVLALVNDMIAHHKVSLD